MYKIDPFCFDKYFQLFKMLVENNDKTPLISFLSSHYLEKEEGYKDEIYRIARKKLKYWKWNKKSIGTGVIFKEVISSVQLEKNINNLVDWRLADKFADKISNKEKIKSYEEAFYNFFQNKTSDADSFNIFIEHFGKNYPLLAYFFYIKDKAQYLPISSTRLDKSLGQLGVVDFKTSHKCSWVNYTRYINLIKQVKELLINEGLKDVSLINAHSFVWILDEKKAEIEKVVHSMPKLESDVKQYLELPKKEKDAVIKARTGQGIFREQLLGFWQTCSVTGCKNQELLIASHIKPFRSCNDREAIDSHNGFLLVPNIDKLFDHGFISFNDSGEIIISSQLEKDDMDSLGVEPNMAITKIEDDHKKYLVYHREQIFKK